MKLSKHMQRLVKFANWCKENNVEPVIARQMAHFAKSKSLDDLAHFANWCKINGITPEDGAELMTLAHARFDAAERACNEAGFTSDKEDAAVEAKAKALGWGIEYNGLMPTFIGPDGRDIYPAAIDGD